MVGCNNNSKKASELIIEKKQNQVDEISQENQEEKTLIFEQQVGIDENQISTYKLIFKGINVEIIYKYLDYDEMKPEHAKLINRKIVVDGQTDEVYKLNSNELCVYNPETDNFECYEFNRSKSTHEIDVVINQNNSNFSDSNNESLNSTTNPKKAQTVDEYEASIPIESVQSPLYARYGGNCFVICRTEDNAKLRTHVTDYKGYFIEDIKSALDGRETKYFSSEIRNNGSFVKFSFNGMSYDLTKRQCERLIYDFNHPKPYLGH